MLLRARRAGTGHRARPGRRGLPQRGHRKGRPRRARRPVARSGARPELAFLAPRWQGRPCCPAAQGADGRATAAGGSRGAGGPRRALRPDQDHARGHPRPPRAGPETRRPQGRRAQGHRGHGRGGRGSSRAREAHYPPRT